MLIPEELKSQQQQIFRQLGGPFRRLLEHELAATYKNLADAHDEIVLRQLQGRARFIKELLNQIDASQ